MTLLEEAKRLVEAGSHHVEGRYSDACAFCHFGDPDHASDCPWRAMPRIVAVLGAAEKGDMALFADLALAHRWKYGQAVYQREDGVTVCGCHAAMKDDGA